MWLKKIIKIVDFNELNNTIEQLSQHYKIQNILQPRYLDQNIKYKIIVWVYLTIPKFLITIEEYHASERDNIDGI